jgi:hypothetical protein
VTSFGGIYRLHIHDRRVSYVRNQLCILSASRFILSIVFD